MRSSGRPLRLEAALAITLVAMIAFGAASQAPSSGWITQIEIDGLVPFQVSFRLTNQGPTPLGDVVGRVTLSDRVGQIIDVYGIEPFSLMPGASSTIVAGSRWSFQQTGIYLAEITLEFSGALISNSLAFRILPVRLPLAPFDDPVGAGLYTVYQQPINWGLARISAQAAWEITHGREGVVVAVIDSGIDHSIDQLADSMWTNAGEIPGNGIDDDGNGYVDDIHGWDFRDGDASSLVGSTLHWHGTFVAGLIAARPGRLPIVGVAPGVRLMDVRFLDSRNSFFTRDWATFAEAIDYAVDNGAQIINLSIFSNGTPPATFEAALRRAAGAGVAIIGISGNDGEEGDNSVLHPGKSDSIYAVAATTENDLRADFSGQGPEVAFCAPGENVTSFVPGGGTSTRSGTSFAAPHVTGVLALILSADPRLSPLEAIAVLRNTLIDLGPRGRDTSFGDGLVDAAAAVGGL